MAKILYYTGFKVYPDQNLVKVFMVRDPKKLPKSLDVNMGKVMTTKKQWEAYKWVILANLKKHHKEVQGIRNIKIL